MKYLTGSILILILLFSCSKDEIEFDPEAPIIGKWELTTELNNEFVYRGVKEHFFNFDSDTLGIRGIRLNGKFGILIAAWDGNVTSFHDYSLSDDSKVLSINYEDDEVLNYDVLELNKNSLRIKRKNYDLSILEFRRIK